MKTRRWLTWLIFALCALAVVEGLGWITWRALRLERAERDARSEASFQELVRLALWRMESEITPILAQEAARPYFHYSAFYPAGRAYTRMLQAVEPGEVLVPSPLLDATGPYMRVHFQVGPKGAVTSPQAPLGSLRDLAAAQYVDAAFIVLASERLSQLSELLHPSEHQLGNAAQFEAPAQFEAVTPPAAEAPPQQLAGQTLEQSYRISEGEYEARQQAAQWANRGPPAPRRTEALTLADKDDTRSRAAPSPPGAEAFREQNSPDTFGLGAPLPAAAPEPEVELSPFKSQWLTRAGTPELILQRTVNVGGASLQQGIWMDWPALRSRLLAITADLLPDAALEPNPQGAPPVPASRMLASIPARLNPGRPPVAIPEPLWSPARLTLGMTWGAVLCGILAIGLVLRKSMELGDRRGRFVSAVTHELRTPLTTFRLYTGMLAGGMVGEESRREYLATLEAESGRLARIVENVLDYAGLGGRAAQRHAGADAADLLAQITPSLQRTAARCGMEVVAGAPLAPGLRVTADPATLERILLNLVDNACKYAAGSSDRRIHLDARRIDRRVRAPLLEVSVRDHGPGIPRSERRRIFRPFHRARRDAEGPQTGLGLGLALSRGLARELGGDLELGRDRADGAELRLTLPICRTNC